MISHTREQILEELNFVTIEEGSFLMGTRWDREHFEYLMKKYTIFIDWFIKEVPQRNVHLPMFEIAEIPVTIGQVRMFLEETDYPAGNLPDLMLPNLREAAENLPAYPMTAELAAAFCNWLGEGQDGWHYDLPTEEEWEKAARGTEPREFPWGSAEDPQRINTNECGPGHVLPVRHTRKEDSPYGVYDLAGNVEEMTRTFNAPYVGMPITLPDYLRYRILRGGTAEHRLDLARCARRHGKHPSRFTGLRIVRRKHLLNQASETPELRLGLGDFFYASINYVNDTEVSVDLEGGGIGITPAKQFTSHDFQVFANLHSKSEIILQVVGRDGENVLCKRPNLDQLDELMLKLNFDKVVGLNKEEETNVHE